MKIALLFLTLAVILGWLWWQMFGRPLLADRRRRAQMWAELQAWDEIVRTFHREL